MSALPKAMRLSNLLSVLEDVIGWSRLPDENTTDAWLLAMHNAIELAVFACKENNDLERAKLERIRIECKSLLNVIHAKAWTPQSEPYEIGRLQKLLPELEKAIEIADEQIELESIRRDRKRNKVSDASIVECPKNLEYQKAIDIRTRSHGMISWAEVCEKVTGVRENNRSFAKSVREYAQKTNQTLPKTERGAKPNRHQ